MRRSTILVLAALGASCAPPPPPSPPPAPPPEPAPAAAPSAKPAAPRDATTGPAGESVSIAGQRIRITLPGGGERTVDPGDLHPPPGDRSLYGISPTAALYLDDGTLVVGEGDGTVTVFDPASHRLRSVGLRGAVRGLTPAGAGLFAVTTDRGVAALMTAEGRLRWERQVTGERLGKAVVAPDGAILVASGRGVFAISPAGAPLFSHASLTPHNGCESEVRSCEAYLQRIGYSSWARGRCERGREACASWEPALKLEGDQVSLAGGLTFRLGDPHPEVPALTPSFPVTFHKVLDGSVISLLAVGPGEILALTTNDRALSTDGYAANARSASDDTFEVVRVAGDRTTRIKVPAKARKREVFLKGQPALAAYFIVDSLVAGPNGKPWILARREHPGAMRGGDGMLGLWGGAGQILEIDGATIREHNEHFAAFAGHGLTHEISAAPGGTASLLCFGDDDPRCLYRDGGGVHELSPRVSVLSVGRAGDQSFAVTADGAVLRAGPSGFAQLPAGGAAFKAVAGASPADIWGAVDRAHTVLRFDGQAWSPVPVPTESVEGFFVVSAGDVWSTNGRIHWDGKAWSRVFGAPSAFGAPIAPTVASPGAGEVWMAGGDGLWHGRAPGPRPVKIPEAPLPGDAAPAAGTLGAAETRYRVDRQALDVAGGEALSSARSVSASPGGVVWFQSWDRLVEVTAAGKAKALGGAGASGAGRLALPEGEGRGILLSRGAIEQISGKQITRDDVQLVHHDLVSAHADKGGSAWILGSSSGDDFAPHALVRAGREGPFRPALGLPAARWCDVAAAPDGGAFFAGALSEGPAGEGILFHARGRLGAGGAARHRAPAALLAVTAASADEAWAVGAAGIVIHVRGDTVLRYEIPGGEWLRAAHAAAPDDVWIGGDGGALLHYDGKDLRPVATPLGARATITGIASAQGAVWAVGPSGILKITRRP